MNPDVPVSFTSEVAKALSKLKRIRIDQERILGHLYDRIENKRSLVAIRTYKMKKPSSVVLVPQSHKYLREYFHNPGPPNRRKTPAALAQLLHRQRAHAGRQPGTGTLHRAIRNRRRHQIPVRKRAKRRHPALQRPRRRVCAAGKH